MNIIHTQWSTLLLKQLSPVNYIQTVHLVNTCNEQRTHTVIDTASHTTITCSFYTDPLHNDHLLIIYRLFILSSGQHLQWTSVHTPWWHSLLVLHNWLSCVSYRQTVQLVICSNQTVYIVHILSLYARRWVCALLWGWWRWTSCCQQ